MRQQISWTRRCDDGVKREVRVEITEKSMKWQFKRKDDAGWDYSSLATPDDWNELEHILERRMKRGKGFKTREIVQKMRRKAGV